MNAALSWARCLIKEPQYVTGIYLDWITRCQEAGGVDTVSKGARSTPQVPPKTQSTHGAREPRTEDIAAESANSEHRVF